MNLRYWLGTASAMLFAAVAAYQAHQRDWAATVFMALCSQLLARFAAVSLGEIMRREAEGKQRVTVRLDQPKARIGRLRSEDLRP